MAEQFQAGISGGTSWMNSSKGVFGGCSSPIADLGSFGWGAEVVDVKARSSACEDSNITSVSDSPMAFQSFQKPESNGSGGGGGSILMDSTLPMMGFGLSSSSSTSDWNPSLLRGNGSAENFNSMIQRETNPRLNCQQETVMDSSQNQKDWSSGENCSTTDFLLDQQRLNSVTSCGNTTVGFPVGLASSVLLQNLFVPDQPQPQQSLFNNRSMNYMSNELSPSWPKLQPPIFKPSVIKQQSAAAAGGLHFSNNTPFWNASTTSPTLNNARTNFLPSSQPQFLVPTFEEKPSCPTITTKTEEVRDQCGVMKRGSTEPAFKRPRLETPSPLPTFKVRKEKLGDRVTALQQLVSPFGKTDTASVLHEAIECIKFLHEQVSVLSTPYMKQGASIQHQQRTEKSENVEEPQQDLRSRGLCLVPISSTFPVTNETTAHFWTPTFGGTFR
ncbi:hypothetical protein SLE2022_391950 [Rubroshorea leprosula]